MILASTPADLVNYLGATAGPTDPVEITVENVRDFDESTGAGHNQDHMIGPFFALSLTNLFLPQLLTVETFSMGVNVGLDGVEFHTSIGAPAQLTGSATVISAEHVGEGVQIVVRVDIIDHATGRLVARANTVSRFFA